MADLRLPATKETAKIAHDKLVKLSDSLDPGTRLAHSHLIIYLDDFLTAARNRLPSQAAVDADKARRKSKTKPRKPATNAE